MHAEELRRYLSDATARPIQLCVTRNMHNMVTVTPWRPGPGLKVRIHALFLEADPSVHQALVDFVLGPTSESRVIIRRFIAENNHRLGEQSAPKRRRAKGIAQGRVYDLRSRAAALNEAHFGGALQFHIEWNGSVQPPAKGRLRYVTLGHWDDRGRTIRLHPMLDSVDVPPWFLDFVIFHEMAHIVVPAEHSCTGRRAVHTPAFYAVETRYPLLAAAKAWEAAHLPAVIRRWARGIPQETAPRPREAKKERGLLSGVLDLFRGGDE